jgi:predicted PurR-regulated permease PerM
MGKPSEREVSSSGEGWATGTLGGMSVLRVAVVGLFVIALLHTLLIARALLVPIVVGMLLGTVFTPLVDYYRKRRVPAALAAALIVVTLILLVAALAKAIADPLSDWLDLLPATLSSLQSALKHWWIGVSHKIGIGAAASASSSARVAPEVAAQGISLTGTVVVWLQQFAAGAIAALILLYFLLAAPGFFTLKLVRVLPRLADKMKAVEIVRTVSHDVSHYFLIITCINAGLGAATAVLTYALGMPTPLLWGVIAMLFNFVPYLGPASALLVLTFAAFHSLDTPGAVAAVPAIFFGLILLEGQVLNPLIVGNRLSCSPVVVFLSLAFWFWMWGVAGLVVAVPILVVLKTFANHVPALAPLGEFLSNE